MATKRFSDLINMGSTAPAADDGLAWRDKSDTTEAATGTTKRWEWLDFLRELFATRFGADAGSTDTYAVTLSPAPVAYVTGEHYRFKANTANTGVCTVNFNSLGAKTIKKAAGGITTDLADNDIRVGQWVDLVYDGTNMQMQSLLGNAPAGGAGGFAASGANADITSMSGLAGALENPSQIIFPEGAAPSTPSTSKVALYAKSDGLLYSKDDAGAETLVSGGAGGGSSYAGVTTGGTGSLDMAQGTKTADEPFFDATVTWNNGSINFNGIKLNATITAAGGGSKLLDLQKGGVSQFSVQAVSGTTQWAAVVPIGSNSQSGLSFQGDTTTGLSSAGNIEFNVSGSVAFRVNSGNIHIVPSGGIEQRNDGPYRWQSGTRLLQNGNGQLRVEGNSDGQGDRIIFGTVNTSGAMIKRNGTKLEAKLADDSAYTQFTCQKLGVNNSASASIPGTIVKKIEVFDASGTSLGFIAVFDAIT